MKVLVNHKKQAQCPSCEKWNDLQLDHVDGIYHEFTCCNRNFIVPLDEENLEKIAQGRRDIELPKPGWEFKDI